MKKRLLSRAVQAALLLTLPGAAYAQQADQPQDPATQQSSTLDSVVVTGSRIPRAQVEGPAPVSVITAEDIQAGGFTSVPDVMQSLTQNGARPRASNRRAVRISRPVPSRLTCARSAPTTRWYWSMAGASPTSHCRSVAAATSPMSPACRWG